MFCYEFRLAYVGSSGDEAQSKAPIISECAKAINFIKMSWMDGSSKWFIITLPDSVYLKMMTHTAIVATDITVDNVPILNHNEENEIGLEVGKNNLFETISKKVILSVERCQNW